MINTSTMDCPPVLMIVFNRPDHAAKVFAEVRKAKPSKLYVAIDGPRDNREDDVTGIGETLKIFDGIDWECSVQKLVRKKNLGCKMAVSSGITWFFENEESGVVLEDDCLPSPSFFPYCAHLLERHRFNDSVMHISGVNFQDGDTRGKGSYYYSKICYVWGWASWRRAWQKYDIKMEGLDDFFEERLDKSIIPYGPSSAYWKTALKKTQAGQIDTWDYQWVFSIWKNNGLCITPNHNLITNIGFDDTATHTKQIDTRIANKSYEILEQRVKDVDILLVDRDADEYIFKKFFVLKKNFRKKTVQEIKKVLKIKSFRSRLQHIPLLKNI